MGLLGLQNAARIGSVAAAKIERPERFELPTLWCEALRRAERIRRGYQMWHVESDSGSNFRFLAATWPCTCAGLGTENRREMDKLIIRVFASAQLLISLVGFPFVIFALNYGGAAANPGVLPLILLYLFYGVVTAVLLYSTRTFARVLAFVWHALLVARVIGSSAFANRPIVGSGRFVPVLLISIAAVLYLGATSFGRYWPRIAATVRQWSVIRIGFASALLIFVIFALARFNSYTNSVGYQESLLHSPNQEVRCAAAKELAKTGPAAASALPALKSMMNSTSCIQFGSTMNAFEIEKIGGIDPLLDVMREGAPDARRDAAWYLSNTLGSHRDHATVLKQAFAAGLQDQDPGVRQASAAGLGTFGAAAAEFLPQLMNLLNDPNPQVRLAAVEAIAGLKSEEGLRQALSNPDSQVRATAIQRLNPIAAPER
jgi:hypothetical protein